MDRTCPLITYPNKLDIKFLRGMLLEDGIVKKIEEEKETATCELSAAENFLNNI